MYELKTFTVACFEVSALTSKIYLGQFRSSVNNLQLLIYTRVMNTGQMLADKNEEPGLL